MAKIGNWWLARCQAQPGEIVEWSCLANHTHSPNRAVGGKLFLTNQRLLFCPHLIDYALAARRWEADLTAVRGIVREPPGGEGITGLTDRVRIVLADDSAAWFLVNSPWQSEKLQQVI